MSVHYLVCSIHTAGYCYTNFLITFYITSFWELESNQYYRDIIHKRQEKEFAKFNDREAGTGLKREVKLTIKRSSFQEKVPMLADFLG